MRFPGIGHIIGIGLVLLLILGGCAEITKPRPSRQEIEAVELTALTRQPHVSYKKERAMRVFLRLLPTLPRSRCPHGSRGPPRNRTQGTSEPSRR